MSVFIFKLFHFIWTFYHCFLFILTFIAVLHLLSANHMRDLGTDSVGAYVQAESNMWRKVKRNYYFLQPTSLPMHSDDLTSHILSSHSSSNMPLSENSENDSQLTQMDHSDNIDGKLCGIYINACYATHTIEYIIIYELDH